MTTNPNMMRFTPGRMPVSHKRWALFFTALMGSIFFALGLNVQRVQAGEVTLTDTALTVTFDDRSGALTGLKNNATGWTIERRPELGDSFRLFAPLPERRWNPILGEKQTVSEVKKISDHEIQLQWTNLISENGGILPITLAADVGLTNGVLTFNARVENDSELTVETIDYPYLGDLNPPSRESTNLSIWTMQHSNVDDLIANEVYPHFRNEKGYWGVFWPTKILEADRSPFCLVQSAANEGLYAGIGSAQMPYRLQYTFEQHPGVVSGVTALVPPGDEIDGKPVHLEFRICHLVFQKPHTTIKLAPVVLRCYGGDPHAGADLYKQWRSAL